MIEVFLEGHTRVLNKDGRDITPRAKKARGLIALLALSKEYKRSRVWLIDKLWSDRGEEQGAASLRQTLTELRRVFGNDRDVLKCEGGSVQLDPERVSVVEVDGSADTELCEDLDIRDPEFTDWLRTKRLEVANPVPRTTPDKGPEVPVLIVAVDNSGGVPGDWVCGMMRDNVVRSLQEFGEVAIIDLGDPGAAFPSNVSFGVYLRITASRIGDEVRVSVVLESVSGRWTIWQSPSCIVHSHPTDEEIWQIRAMSQLIFGRLLEAFEEQQRRAPGNAPKFALSLATRASRLAYQFGRSELLAADRLFKAAYEIDPRGSYLSWRGFIRNTAFFEHLTDDFLEPQSGFELHAQALRDDPTNSIALVFAAQHSFVNEQDPYLGSLLCEKALEINPSNAIGWAFKTNMFVLQGENELAAQASRHAADLSWGLPCASLTAIYACMGQAAIGENQAALAFARQGLLTAPKFQAIRRYLFAIYRALDMPTEANDQLVAIRQREPDFVPESIVSSTYPTETLRRLRIAASV